MENAKKKDGIDVRVMNHGGGINGGLIAYVAIPNGQLLRSEETLGGWTRLIPLETQRDDNMRSVRISAVYFDMLCKKRLKNETVKKAIERAINMLPSPQPRTRGPQRR